MYKRQGLAIAALHTRPTAWTWTWGVLGVAGVGLVVLGPEARLDAVGVLAGLGGTAGMAVGVVLTKRWGRPEGVGAMTLAGWQLAAGGVVLLPLTVLFEGAPPAIDAEAAAGYLWLGGMGGLISFTLWFRGIGRLPVGASAPLVLLSPLVATLVGLTLGETLGTLQALGFALALTALLAAQFNSPDLSRLFTKRRDPEKDMKDMTIAVLGSTGMVGSRVVAEAAARGHRVRALSRKPAAEHPNVTSHPVDASDPDALREALAGADAVVVAVRTEPVDQDFLVGTTRAVLDSGIRVLVVGGAGVLRSPEDPALPVADNPVYVPAEVRPVAAAGVAQLRACEAHSDDGWVYLAPPALLEPGERTGRYRRGTDTLLTAPDGRSWISAEDLSVAVLDELEHPGTDRLVTVGHH